MPCKLLARGGELGDDDRAAVSCAQGLNHGDADGPAAEDEDVISRLQGRLGDRVPAYGEWFDEGGDVKGDVVG